MPEQRSTSAAALPPALITLLRRLRDTGNPDLNTVLSAAHAKGWTAPQLAEVLQAPPGGVSKRIERGKSGYRARVLRTELTGIEQRITADIIQRAAADDPDAMALLRRRDSARRRLATALADEPAVLRLRGMLLAQYDIPPPDPAQPSTTTMTGRRLDPARLERLRVQQLLAQKVNGALEPDDPLRKAGEAFSRELHQIIDVEGYPVYYVAKELGVTPRAITSRLERHGYRDLSPSMQGVPSGRYRRKKIGGPQRPRGPRRQNTNGEN